MLVIVLSEEYCPVLRTIKRFFETFRCEKSESGTEIGNSLELDFVVPPPHS